MSYVDGFVMLVTKKNLPAYRKVASKAGKMWMKYGALGYKECAIDDKAPKGVVWTYAKMTGAKPNEVVVFSFITYKNKAHRDAVNKKVMSDPSMKGDMKDMPFDMNKLAWAGFKPFVDLS